MSSVDESMITGESIPVLKSGRQADSGSLNLLSLIKLRYSRWRRYLPFSDDIPHSGSPRIKIPIQALADRITNVFVPIVFCLPNFGIAVGL